MLTVSEDRLQELAQARGRQVSIRLFGQESNPETYAITKADLLLKGEGEQADNIHLGSTLSDDAFRGKRFDKNCELSADDIARIIETHNTFADGEHSKVFPNRAFGYWKLRIERPLRLKSQLSKAAVEGLRYASGDEDLRRELFARFGDDLYERFDEIRQALDSWLRGDDAGDGADADDAGVRPDADDAGEPTRAIPERRRRKLLDPKTWRRDRELLRTARALREHVGGEVFDDHNLFRRRLDEAMGALGLKPSAADKKVILAAVSRRDETAAPVIRKLHEPKKGKLADPLHGFYAVPIDGKTRIVEYEPDPELRDTEQVPMMEEIQPGAWIAGDVKTFFEREVKPHLPDAWIDGAATKVGYEISFTRWFYKPKPLRTLAKIRADIEAEQRRTEGLLEQILVDIHADADRPG